MKKELALHFKCRCCGNCCSTKGRAYLYQNDIVRIPEFLQIGLIRFIRKFCEYRKEIFVFKDRTVCFEILALAKSTIDDSCIFLEEAKCKINSFKPLQCLLAPFIKPIITDKSEWEKFISKCVGFSSGNIYDYKYLHDSMSRFNTERSMYHLWMSRHQFSLEKALNIKIGKPIEIVIHIDHKYCDYNTYSNYILKSIFNRTKKHN